MIRASHDASLFDSYRHIVHTVIGSLKSMTVYSNRNLARYPPALRPGDDLLECLPGRAERPIAVHQAASFRAIQPEPYNYRESLAASGRQLGLCLVRIVASLLTDFVGDD